MKTPMSDYPYRYPHLRHGVMSAVRAELRLKALLRSLRHANGWTVAPVVVALLALVFRTWATAIALGIMLTISAALWLADHRREELSNIAETDSLSGAEFERWLEEFFRKLGFRVERTPYQGDFGADLIITWNGIKTAVQAKSGHQNVGVAAVQQIVAAKAFYDCERAMVVTNQYFTPQALILANATGVVMRHRGDLARKLAESVADETAPSPPASFDA
jgi:restriction system protein